MLQIQPQETPEIETDPFGERSSVRDRRVLQLLGGRFHFDSDSAPLLALVDAAYAGLPAHRLPGKRPDFRIRLALMPGAPARTSQSAAEPPPIRMLEGPGMLGGAAPSSNFVLMSIRERSALVVVTPQMLRFAYHTRYEWIEFAVFTLAARCQNLVPLHAACVGLGGRGVLIMGPSGAGKSTLALHSALTGFEFLAEDSVFIAADSLLATAVPNFLHVRPDSVGALHSPRDCARIRRSPIIRRRSGIEKFEVDLRRPPFRLSSRPVRIMATVFLSPRKAGDDALLTRVPKSRFKDRLKSLQGYGASLPPWRTFERRLATLDAFELSRGRHPRASVDAIRTLLDRR